MPSASSSLRQVAAGLGDVALALVALLADEALDLLVLARVQRREGEVLELPLDRVDAEPVRQRRVDLERLLGLLDLLLLRHRVERAHVVQAVGELDQDDPDVRGHRDHHLAVVLGLRLVARLERDAGELGHAVDQARDLLAERLADLVERSRVVSSTVSCRSAAHSVSVSSRMPAQIFATPTGWTMKSSPDWRRWSAWCSQAKTNASITRRAVDLARRPRRRAPRRSRTGRRAARARAAVRSAGASAARRCACSGGRRAVGRDRDVADARRRRRGARGSASPSPAASGVGSGRRLVSSCVSAMRIALGRA